MMTDRQKIEIKEILAYFASLKPEEVETAFDERWKPLIQSLTNEKDRATAFQLFYEWQIEQMDALAKHISQLPIPESNSSSGSKKAVA